MQYIKLYFNFTILFFACKDIYEYCKKFMINKMNSQITHYLDVISL
jgi:hypothetical protein